LKKVICLGGGNNQVSVIKSASRLGLEVITVDRNNIAKGKKISNYFINKSTGDPIKIFEELKSKKISDNIIGVLNRSSSYPVITNSVLSNLLNLESYPKDTAEKAISKGQLNKTLGEKNILVPKSIVFNEELDIKEFIYPFIFKLDITPGGKLGVKLINSKEGVLSYLESFKKRGQIIKEEYIEGRDISFGAVINNGELFPLVILEEWHKINSQGDISVKGISVLDNESSTHLLKQLIKVSNLVKDILKIKNSFFWISFKYTPKKDLYFIELHLDMGGDFVLDHLLPKATNLNYPIDNFLEIYLFGKKNYKGMFKVIPTSIEYDKGSSISEDGRLLSIINHRSYESVKKHFEN
tara:strand:- start:10370 stop:11428 length:1059 start_codon:yes stop_codon:yes gene_type:complete